MSMHDVAYVSPRRRALGIPPRRPFSVPRSLQHGSELQRLKSLPWPRNLFGEHATIAELLTPRAARGEEYPDDLCACGCGKEHRQRVSRILPKADVDRRTVAARWPELSGFTVNGVLMAVVSPAPGTRAPNSHCTSRPIRPCPSATSRVNRRSSLSSRLTGAPSALTRWSSTTKCVLNSSGIVRNR
jgi:hypothetical protein